MAKPNDRPVVESFSIRGLNRYKDVELGTSTAAKIISAENGTGKTTIMNALYGVLSGKYNYLTDIGFDSLSVKFEGQDEIIATYEDIRDSLSGQISDLPSSLTSYFLKYGSVTDSDLHKVIELFAADGEGVEYSDAFQRIYASTPHSTTEIISKLREILDRLPQSSLEPNSFRRSIAEAMTGFRVLYFPTYRRIEAEIPGFSGPRRNERFKEGGISGLERW